MVELEAAVQRVVASVYTLVVLFFYCAEQTFDVIIQDWGLVYNSPSPSSRVMMPLIEDGGERRPHIDFGDDVTTMSSDTACQSWWACTYLTAFISACL